MDIATYMREARRFDNHRQDILLDGLSDGLAAECAELLDETMRPPWRWDAAALLSEAGDVQWELARIASDVHVDVALLVAADLPDVALDEDAGLQSLAARLVVEAGKVSGHMEKHRRIVRPERSVTIAGIQAATVESWKWLALVAAYVGYTMEQVRQANIDKLTARYAERGLPVKEAS